MGKVGIFWVIKGEIFAYTQSIEETLQKEQARVDMTGVVDSSFSHYKKWEETLSGKYPYADFATYPRGRVVFSLARREYIIYVDECITNGEIAKVVKKFDLDAYRIDYDEHYSCDNCIDKKDLF